MTAERPPPPATAAPTPPLRYAGLVGNAVLLGYVVIDDPRSLYWVFGLLAVGVMLFLIEYAFGKNRNRPPGAGRGNPEALSGRPAEKEL